MGMRIRFLWFLTVLALLAELYSPKILVLYISFMAFLALKEFLSITPTRRADRRVLFWTYLVIPVQFFVIWQGWYQAFILVTPFYMFFLNFFSPESRVPNFFLLPSPEFRLSRKFFLVPGPESRVPGLRTHFF